MKQGDTIQPVRPDDFDPENLENRDTLVLGAPYIGKSHLFRESEADHERVTRIDEALEAREDEFVVIDEFYTAYQGAREDERREFESWLDRDGGVCVVARPRDIDWLLESDDVPLSETFVETFEEVYFLRYRPDEGEDRKRATECCQSILEEDSDGSVTQEDIEENIDELFRTNKYEFDNPAVRKRLGTESYSETLVPALVVYFSNQLADGGGAIIPDGVSVCKDILQDASFAKFYNETRDACLDLFSRETLSELGSVASEAVSDPRDVGKGAFAAASSISTSQSGHG